MLTKHKIFNINIIEGEEDDSYDFGPDVFNVINEFLANSNNVYLNHSITALGIDTSSGSNRFRMVNLIVSLVYKDLTDSPNQLQNVSNTTMEIVQKSIEIGEDMQMPKHQTTFDEATEKNVEDSLMFLVGNWRCQWGEAIGQSEICTINIDGEYFVNNEHWFNLSNVKIDIDDRKISFDKISVRSDDSRNFSDALEINTNDILMGKETLIEKDKKTAGKIIYTRQTL